MDDSPPLMAFVKALEGKDGPKRARVIQDTLETQGLNATVQECRWPRIKNLVVDFSPASQKQHIFSAHYDVAGTSPGANDNASGVAVLLGLCHELRHTQIPIRIVFFDREEAWLRTPLIRLGLLGSLYYVLRNNVRDVACVHNLEFCGAGDRLGIWPIKGCETELPAFKRVVKAAEVLGLKYSSHHIPWFIMSSDHLPFRLRGMRNSLTISLLPSDQVPALTKFFSKPVPLRLSRRDFPEPLRFIHTSEDTSSRLNEESLCMMLNLLLSVINHR